MADSAKPLRLRVLGVPVDCVDRTGVESWLAEGLGHCRHVVTLNPETVMMARRVPALAAAIERADLITIDGIGVLLALRLLHRDTGQVERVTGVDLLQRLSETSSTIFLLGGRSGNAAKAAERLGTSVVGFWDGGTPNLAHDRDSLRRIGESGASVLAVAYGVPAQTMWIDRNRDALTSAGVGLAIGVGGAIDFLSGDVPRAPGWTQRIGLEWLYRLIREPWRWRRQLVLPVFAVNVVWARMRNVRRAD